MNRPGKFSTNLTTTYKATTDCKIATSRYNGDYNSTSYVKTLEGYNRSHGLGLKSWCQDVQTDCDNP